MAFTAASLLGCNKSVKCIVGVDGNFELTSSTVKLFQIVDVEHPAISIIYDASRGLKNYHGTGCATLVFMVGSWLQSYESLVDKGIPLPIVHQLFDDALACCLEEIVKHELLLEGVVDIYFNANENKTDSECDVMLHCSNLLGSTATKTDIDTSQSCLNSSSQSQTKYCSGKKECLPERKAFLNKYSRHLMQGNTEESQNDSMNELIKRLTIGLSRGNNVIAKLLEKTLGIVRSQNRCLHFGGLKLDVNNIFTEILDNKPSEESFVFEGLCISIKSSDVSVLVHGMEGKFIKICLLDFDPLSHCSKHVQMPTAKKYSESRMSHVNHDYHNYDNGVWKLLSSFGVSCILYKGDKAGFCEECSAHGVIAINISSYKHLQALSVATGAAIISSLGDMDEDCIGHHSVKLSVLRSPKKERLNDKTRGGNTTLVSIEFSQYGQSFITVMLCATTLNMAALLEESFWSACYKLRNILNHGQCLIGGGEIERKCIEKLRLPSEKRHEGNRPSSQILPRWMQIEADLYRDIVYDEFARGIERYVLQLSTNAMGNHRSGIVLDDPVSKTEAWKRAVKLVQSITKVDMVITTGVDEGSL
eukprot:gene3671-4188_t